MSMQFSARNFFAGRSGTDQAAQSIVDSLPRKLTLVVLAVLLGRASIEHVVSPFGLAYFAVLTELAGTKRSWPAVFALAGAYWQGGWHLTAIMAVQFVLYRLLRKGIFLRKAPDIHWIPFLAGLIDVATRLAAVGSVWSRYDIILALSEGALTIILSLIFIQCLPVFVGRDPNRSLRPEQLVSLTIFVGSVVTGLNGIAIHGVDVAPAAVDWIVLVMAVAGGVSVGTPVAIVIGIIAMMGHSLTLVSVAVLGFAGLLAGILKEAGRFWVALSFVASVLLLTASSNSDWNVVFGAGAAALAASVLFVLTPKRLRQELATYVPGTAEHRLSEQQRVRRIRTLLSEKIQDLAQVFDELSVTFADTGDTPLMSAQQLLDHTVGRAAKTVCAACPRRQKCWEKEGLATYQSIVHTVARLESSSTGNIGPAPELKERCIRIDSMMGVLRHNLEITDRDAKWIDKMREQKTLVAAQLSGVAGVVRSVAGQIERGNETSQSGEEQILAALEQLGLYVDCVHIVSLEPGKVEIEVSQPSQGAYENSVRMIAPLLSGIVGENITATQVAGDEPGPCKSVFTSASLYDVSSAVSTVARDGKVVSGDTHTSLDLGNGRYALAVSDGMGNGERARRESKAAIELLKKLLRAGFDEQLAIKTVNSTLLLRSREEMFTTLDMALIDLFSAKAEFLKIGSAPSFIKRGDSVFSITGANVPIGILQDIEVQTVNEQLQDGDILILMSDGLYDAPQQSYDKEDWLKRQIEGLETSDPQQIADTLIESAVHMNHGQILDDMTVLVATVKLRQPEWAAIKLPGVVGLRSDRKKRGA
ncbi:stage II sporulation protein E [Alicyclobacillus tolerans]|uniref:stage II sporulation protein E n=1 Tax=Alicyclobacillus tolerans TaxID=90970 RepID=UPI001F03232C|nr:stage II sporulation protein E [Alicyclobacillus tolerans]MCF8568256.1 stage II sporulation protein E [Alicyclobacillus tolerans]